MPAILSPPPPSLAEDQPTEQISSVKLPSKPSLPTPPLENSKDDFFFDQAQQSIAHLSLSPSIPTTSSTTNGSNWTEFPVAVVPIPNRGRCYLATRDILPDTLVFKAEPFGTCMCDSWLDCGICHYCWNPVPNRKDQIRLPNTVPGKKRQETVMVFCNDHCLQQYGPTVAETICAVEKRIRVSWKASLDVNAFQSVLPKSKENKGVEYLEKVLELTGSSREGLKALKDNSDLLETVLDCVWGAVDEVVKCSTQAMAISHVDQAAMENTQKLNGKHQKQQKQQQQPLVTFATIAGLLFPEGMDSHLSDDDCELARFLTEILCRIHEQKDQRGQSAKPTIEDYLAMQSNEVNIFGRSLTDSVNSDEVNDENQPSQHHQQPWSIPPASRFFMLWSQVLTLLPMDLLDRIHLYLRLRDALMTVSKETKVQGMALTTTPLDNVLFRKVLFREVANSFGIRDKDEELLGFAVFPRASFFNHSCDPNVRKIRVASNERITGSMSEAMPESMPRRMEYYSNRLIKQGEECCISYGDISLGRDQRQERLASMYFFDCSCNRCEAEMREKVTAGANK